MRKILKTLRKMIKTLKNRGGAGGGGSLSYTWCYLTIISPETRLNLITLPPRRTACLKSMQIESKSSYVQMCSTASKSDEKEKVAAEPQTTFKNN